MAKKRKSRAKPKSVPVPKPTPPAKSPGIYSGDFPPRRRPPK